jgi:hypothetical protein
LQQLGKRRGGKTPLITDELFVTLAKPAVMQVWSRL